MCAQTGTIVSHLNYPASKSCIPGCRRTPHGCPVAGLQPSGHPVKDRGCPVEHTCLISPPCWSYQHPPCSFTLDPSGPGAVMPTWESTAKSALSCSWTVCRQIALPCDWLLWKDRRRASPRGPAGCLMEGACQSYTILLH